MTDAQPAAPRREIPVTRREIFGWAMFDFANSCYTTVVITAVYSAFFVRYIVPEGSGARDSYWSTAILLSMVAALILSPLAGAIIDKSGRKKAWLFASCLICSIGTAGLFFVQPGDVWLAILLIVIGNTGFMLSEAFCSSFLPDLATPENMGKISGLGWGIGYLGGLASVFIASQVIIKADPTSQLATYVAQNQLAMLAMAVFFMVAATPTFALVRNRSLPAPGFERATLGQLVRAGVAEFVNTVQTARHYRVLFQFLIAFMVYMAGLDAIVKFVGIYAREDIGLTGGEFVILFLALQLSAVAGALGFGFLEGKLGPKRTVMATLIWWIIGVLGIYLLDPLAAFLGVGPKQLFYGLGLFAGAGIGATQASSRTVVGLLAPKDKSAQMFGFWGMFSRLGSILGVGFGYVADAFGSRRAGVLLVVIFFVVGALLLSRVDIDRGVREAQSA
ncbi:MAG: MFS transporter [Gemmatimonadales bacterium]|nr:MFS transporter [Gemmatimonadales bacterium]